MVRQGKKATHKSSRIEDGLTGPSKLQRPVSELNSASCDGQLNGGTLHKQTRRNSLSRNVRSPVEDHGMVSSLSHNIKSQTHSRVSECDGQPSVQVKPSAVNRMVTAPTGVQTDLSKVVHSSCRSICHSSEPQTVPLYIFPVPDQNTWDIDALNINWTGLTAYAYPPTALLPRVIQKIRQCHHHNSPRLAMDALVLEPIAVLNSCCQKLFSNSPTIMCSTAIHNIWCLGVDSFSVEVTERIAAPQRPSTRTIYKSKWVLFEKWCRENSVDFSTPSVKQISDFFMYLFQDLNRRPSTIDGYRKAIVDTLGPVGHHIAQSSDLHMLLSSFYRDHPKSSRNLPKWNLSVVLNELTKAPFEPVKGIDLKHLSLKTAFLLPLASGKRHNKIHAWVANKVSNLGRWEKVALFPSSDFIAKNQLAREGSQSVSPVTIPALQLPL